MPTYDEHIEHERDNALIEAAMRDAGSAGWASALLFYRAVHLVEAVFARHDVHHRSHAQRSRAVAARFPTIHHDYLELLEFSRTARYEAPGAVGWQEYEVAREHFAVVEAALREST